MKTPAPKLPVRSHSKRAGESVAGDPDRNDVRQVFGLEGTRGETPDLLAAASRLDHSSQCFRAVFVPSDRCETAPELHRIP
jgi:hypothetical protein